MKLQKLRKHKVASVAKAAKSVPASSLVGKIGDQPDKKASLSRGQRKRQERKIHIMQKLGKIPMKKKSKNEEKKPMLSEFESGLRKQIAEAGDNSDSIRASAASQITSNKMKKSIAMREAARMKLVQEHPAFQANPLDAVHKHLEQMLALKKGDTSR